LLQALPPQDVALLSPRLERVSLAKGQVVVTRRKPIEYLHFIEDGLGSVIAEVDSRRLRTEIGMIGRDGATGLPLVLGVERTCYETFMQIGGEAWRISAGDLKQAMARSPSLQRVLLAYAHAFLIQVAETALSNGRRSVEQRLARWLLMSQDRIGGDKIALTHEFLALMLGVRRPGVTMALHVLEGNKLIRSTRGLITVLNRAGLEKAAGASYGIAEAEAQRVIAVAQDDSQGGKRSAPMVSA
jgi:CRP-like cAMP-binding protein